MIAPLGQFLTTFDTAMVQAMDTGIVGLCAVMYKPMIGAAIIFYMIKGLDVMKGEVEALDDILFDTLRIMIALAVATDPAWFNPIVRDFFFQGVPAYLIAGVTAKLATLSTQVIAPGVNGVAAALDQVWDIMWITTGAIWGKAGILDVGTRVSVILCVLTAGIALAAMALVYLGSRFILSIVLVCGVIAVALRVIPATRKVFENWLGMVISLTFMQVALVITLTIVVSIDLQFMSAISGPGLPGVTPAPNNGGIASDIQTLVSMVILFGLGAFAIYSLPSIAYTLGGGIAISTAPALLATYSAIRTSINLASRIPLPSGGSPASAPLSLGMPGGPALGGGARSALSSAMPALPSASAARLLLR